MKSALSWMGCGLLFAGVAAAASKSPPVVVPAPAPALAACNASRTNAPNGVTYFRHCEDAPEMVAFRGGAFLMGDALGNGIPYEKPAHQVQIAPFALGRYEVTNAEWLACVAAGGCAPAASAGEPARARHPVTGVNWHQAEAYVQWLAAHTGRPYRLPSEAEWEYAGRAGTTASHYWGDDPDDACDYANAADNAAKRKFSGWKVIGCDDGYVYTSPVGKFKPNKFGLYDMLGNLKQMVAGCITDSISDIPTDGSAGPENCDDHPLRGSSWESIPSVMRMADRQIVHSAEAGFHFGFRVALGQ
jgi:formylglycine-generating enzyme required for sulfatase activity